MRPIVLPATPPRAAARAYAGGFAFNLPGMGTIYSTNITPDKQTGIGNYTDQQFLDALHKGIRADGERLYPAMSYTSYTYHDRRRRAGDQSLSVQPCRPCMRRRAPTRWPGLSTIAA